MHRVSRIPLFQISVRRRVEIYIEDGAHVRHHAGRIGEQHQPPSPPRSVRFVVIGQAVQAHVFAANRHPLVVYQDKFGVQVGIAIVDAVGAVRNHKPAVRARRV